MHGASRRLSTDDELLAPVMKVPNKATSIVAMAPNAVYHMYEIR